MNIVVSNLINNNYQEINKEEFDSLLPENYFPIDDGEVIMTTGDSDCEEDKLKILFKNDLTEIISVALFNTNYETIYYFKANDITTKLTFLQLFVNNIVEEV